MKGDRDLAEQLLYEHGLDPNFNPDLDPEVIEVMAGTGELEDYDDRCPVCKASRNQPCDAGLHS